MVLESLLENFHEYDFFINLSLLGEEEQNNSFERLEQNSRVYLVPLFERRPKSLVKATATRENEASCPLVHANSKRAHLLMHIWLGIVPSKKLEAITHALLKKSSYCLRRCA